MIDTDRSITLPTPIRVGLVLAPLALLLLMYAGSPRFFPPLGYQPATWLGISLGDLLMAGAVAWGLLGGVVVARSRKPYAFAIGFLLFTIPACFVILLGPAIILILQNLG